MNDQIGRLGFDAWADSKFVDAIENLDSKMGCHKEEADGYSMCVTHDKEKVSCVIRAYTHSGWQTYEREIKR